MLRLQSKSNARSIQIGCREISNLLKFCLAHTFMLGPNGDSNGCVSFRDYNAFLNAYRNQGIKRLAVVARVE
jgi:hypothetical protein